MVVERPGDRKLLNVKRASSPAGQRAAGAADSSVIESNAAISESSVHVVKMRRGGFWNVFGVKIGTPALDRFLEALQIDAPRAS